MSNARERREANRRHDNGKTVMQIYSHSSTQVRARLPCIGFELV